MHECYSAQSEIQVIVPGSKWYAFHVEGERTFGIRQHYLKGALPSNAGPGKSEDSERNV